MMLHMSKINKTRTAYSQLQKSGLLKFGMRNTEGKENCNQISEQTIFKTILLLLSLSLGSQASETPYTPEKILPNGVDTSRSVNPYTGEAGEARKGTVAATLNNIALLNNLLADEKFQKAEEIVKAIRVLIPSLKVVGVFNLFTPLEWLSSQEQPGRVLSAILYLQAYPQEITPSLREKLKDIQKQTSISYLSHQIEILLKDQP